MQGAVGADARAEQRRVILLEVAFAVVSVQVDDQRALSRRVRGLVRPDARPGAGVVLFLRVGRVVQEIVAGLEQIFSVPTGSSNDARPSSAAAPEPGMAPSAFHRAPGIRL